MLAPGGGGIGGFGGASVGGKEGREGLRKKALQSLLAGLDYWSEEDAEIGGSPSAKGNAFRYFISKLASSLLMCRQRTSNLKADAPVYTAPQGRPFLYPHRHPWHFLSASRGREWPPAWQL